MTGPSAHHRAKPLAPGTKAPDFDLASTPDQKVSLEDFRGQPVILAFYPEDWSPVCSDQLGLYQMVLPEFQKFGAELMGISVDSAWSHLAFAKDRNLRFVFRNFPITTSHPHAGQAAEAAEAAAVQGPFWEMHDLLYENQQHLEDEDLIAYAERLSLDVERFDKELTEHVHARPGPRRLHERRAERCERHAHVLHQRGEARRLVRSRHPARRVGTSGVQRVAPRLDGDPSRRPAAG